MNARVPVLCALLSSPLVLSGQEGADPARLYGRVQTWDGEVVEGFIRWGANEGAWFDILHGSKDLPRRNFEDAEALGWEPAERENRIEFLGIGITFPGDRESISRTSQSGIRFGHLSSLERLSGSRARVVLKSGEELELEGSGDLGSGVGEISVEDVRGRTTALEWSDLRTVDFMAAPPRASRLGHRLYGTLVTRDGERFTGYIAWDMDEIFGSDVLDGEADGRDREVPFADIRSIVRNGSRSARVLLVDGEALVLSGTNDVNSGNRDILVADPALGEVRVEWDEFDRLEFAPPPAAIEFSTFDGGRRLRGTVETTSGETFSGLIRWDNDEEYTWEILDGQLSGGADLDVEMGTIAAIERRGYSTSVVTLRDGRRLELGDSNDVDEGNRGVYIQQADGRLVLVPWDTFRLVRFEH